MTPPRGGPLYKIVASYEPGRAVPWAEVDRQDGFLHLSAAHQLRETLHKHFAERDDLQLLEIDPHGLAPETLRWEPSRGGDLFPHVYGDIDAVAVVGVDRLARHDGAHVIPPHVPSSLDFGAMPGPLALRLESAEASTMLALGRAATRGSVGAQIGVLVRGRAVAACFGKDTPINAFKGWALEDEPPEVADLLAAEALFDGAHAAFAVELSSHAHPAALSVLRHRGYQAVATENILVRALDELPPGPSAVRLQRAEADDLDAWGHVLAVGFSSPDPPPAQLVGLGRLSATSAQTDAYFIVVDGIRVGACAMRRDHEVALLMGSSILSAHRRRGYQSAAIALRLDRARALGCRYAKLDVAPASGSHRNAHRAGFRLSHTRTAFVRAGGASKAPA